MNTNHDPALAEMQEAARDRLTGILEAAQASTREAARLIASIPPSYRQNGLKAASDGITERLDKADELFVAAFKSVHDTYGRPPSLAEVAA